MPSRREPSVSAGLGAKDGKNVEVVERPTSLSIGSQIEALDIQELWYPARVVKMHLHEVLVSFDGWDSEWDEWLPRSSPRIRKYRGWGTAHIPGDYQISSIIEALDMEGKWYPSRVLHVSETSVMVHYLRWSSKWDEWILKDSGRLRLAGQGGLRSDGDRAETHEDTCGYCEDAGELIYCSGPCRRAYHKKCMPDSNASAWKANSASRWSCSDCKSRRHRCFICKQWGADGLDVHRCSKRGCGKMYHADCLVASLHPFGFAATPPRISYPPNTEQSGADTGGFVAGSYPGVHDQHATLDQGDLLQSGSPCIAHDQTDDEGSNTHGSDLKASCVEWLTTQHRWLGRRVRRFFNGGVTDGTITCWLPASGDDDALWHMSHDDGDAEDLDASEVRAALRAHSEMWTAPRRGLFAEPEYNQTETVPSASLDGSAQDLCETPKAKCQAIDMSQSGTVCIERAASQRKRTLSDQPTPVKSGRRRTQQQLAAQGSSKTIWAGIVCARHWCQICKQPESFGYAIA